MARQMRWTRTIFLGTFVAMTLFATEAFALDAYESRKNVFAGISAGGGYGFVHRDRELIETGPGLQLQAVVGGGITDRLTLGFEADWWSRTVDKGEGDRFGLYHLSGGSVANLFLLEGLHVDGGLGFAYGMCKGNRRDENCEWQELGLAAEGGVGYEFWLTGNLAAGSQLSYTHHFYSHTAFDTISLTFGLRWY